MQKANLLYVITKLELGGAQKQLLTLINLLDKERFNVFLFAAKEGLLTEEAGAIPGLTLRKSIFLERSINPIKDLLALIEIYRFIKRNNIEIVHTHCSKAGILGRWAAQLAKVKLIIHTVHGWSFNDYQPFWIHALFKWLERTTAKFTHKLVVVSQFDKQRGLNARIGSEDKYLLIHYGIDSGEFCRTERNLREEIKAAPEDLLVGNISCFKPQKALQDYIKLACLVNKIMPNVKFLLVGDGVLRSRIEKLLNKFNLQKNVILTGWRRDIPRVLSSLDVFVLTSLWEGLPISALEAMAAAKPVVATNTGGIAEIVKEGETGFLVSAGDMEEMSEKLITLLKDEALRRQMGQNAKSSPGSNFTPLNMASRNQDLYEDLIPSAKIPGLLDRG